MRDIGQWWLLFVFHIVFILFCSQDHASFMEWAGKCSCLCSGRNCIKWVSLLLQIFGRILQRNQWIWEIRFFTKILNYQHNFFSGYRTIQIICFILVEF